MAERPISPTGADVMMAWLEQHALETHVALPGRVESYDAALQVADVVPQVRHPVPQPSGEYTYEDLPVIPSVPVIFPRVGKWFVAMSVEAGDAVQLLFNSASISHWRTATADAGTTGGDRCGRGVVEPGDLARHHLQNAVALVGLETRGNALRHAPPQRPPADAGACLVLGSDLDDGARVSIYGDGSVKITQGSTVVVRVDAEGAAHLGGPDGDPVALAPLVDALMSSFKNHIAAWVPVPQDGGASLKAHLASWSPPDVAATKARAT